MAKTATTLWNPADHLKTDEDMAAYLEAALEEGDPARVAAALGNIARANGMTQVACDAGARPGKSLQVAIAGRQPGVRHHTKGGFGPGPSTACRTGTRKERGLNRLIDRTSPASRLNTNCSGFP